MPKLNELGLTNEKVGDVDFANMPEQRSGGFAPLPQPGDYRFKFPTFDINTPLFDVVDTAKGKRLVLKFEDALALTIVQSPGGEHNGEAFRFRLSNQEFNRAKKGDPDIFASDVDYLLRDVLKVTKRPATNQEYAKVLATQLPGKEMTAALEFTWYCNPNNDIRVSDGQGGSQVVEGTKGCGARYYMGGQKGVQKVHADDADPNSPLIYPERIECSGKDGVPCGAIVRAFAQLRNFRA